MNHTDLIKKITWGYRADPAKTAAQPQEPGIGAGARRKAGPARLLFVTFLAFLPLLILAAPVLAQGPQSVPIPTISITMDQADEPQRLATVLNILFLMTVLTLAPSILILMTSFVRIVVVFSFLRQGMGTQTAPPNQVLIGLALFLTFYVMLPVWKDMEARAFRPFMANEITQSVALQRALAPVREFMFLQTRPKDLALFMQLSGESRPLNKAEVPTMSLIPAFVISELKTAFTIGFLLYIPFVVIDMVVASVLLSMGMMMLPPVMVSLPFKLMLFVLVDGWNLIVGSLVRSFGNVAAAVAGVG